MTMLTKEELKAKFVAVAKDHESTGVALIAGIGLGASLLYALNGGDYTIGLFTGNLIGAGLAKIVLGLHNTQNQRFTTPDAPTDKGPSVPVL